MSENDDEDGEEPWDRSRLGQALGEQQRCNACGKTVNCTDIYPMGCTDCLPWRGWPYKGKNYRG